MRTFKDIKAEIKGCPQYNIKDINRVKALSLLLEESLKDNDPRLHDSEVIFRTALKLEKKYKKLYQAIKHPNTLDMLKVIENYKNKKNIDNATILNTVAQIKKEELSLEKVLQVIQYTSYYEYITYDQVIDALNSLGIYV
jgi:hypothetical protein